MKNTLKIDHSKKRIIMDRTFAKLSENTMSDEYAHLQRVRNDYPNYAVIRREIKKNPNKECWKGLTYDYMRNHIRRVEGNNSKAVLDELEEKILISECHSNCHRYPVIKKWFLKKYPEIANFGLTNVEEKEDEIADAIDQSAMVA